MRLLALLVGGAGSAVAALGGPRGAVERVAVGTPSERLPSLVRQVVEEAGLRLSELETLAVLTGPGSFTAIRAAVAAARALALATGRPVHALSALELGAELAGGDGPVLVLAPAGRGEMAAQLFADRDHPLGEPSLLGPDDIAAATVGAPRWVLVDPEPGSPLTAAGPAEVVRTSGLALARAALARAGRGRPPLPGPAIRPLYLRRPDARPEAGRPLVVAV